MVRCAAMRCESARSRVGGPNGVWTHSRPPQGGERGEGEMIFLHARARAGRAGERMWRTALAPAKSDLCPRVRYAPMLRF